MNLMTNSLNLSTLFSMWFLGIFLIQSTEAITCYICESYRDFRCLDPFDDRPFIQKNCDSENWVREKKPVFCEKRTEIVDGVYVTTRGCSSEYRWEDIQKYIDHRGGPIPCIRRGRKETCLCTTDRCNSAPSVKRNWNYLPHALLVALLSYNRLYS